MSNKSKVKSHIRRTKKGVSRVKEGNRSKRKMSIGKKLAIAGATGVGLVGLGLAGKRLIKEVKAKKAKRDFKPNSDDKFMINVYQGKTKNTSILTDSQIRLERARRVASLPKKVKNQQKVVRRRERFTQEAWLLPSRDSTIAPGQGYIEPDFAVGRRQRRREGSYIADVAKSLAPKKDRFKK